MKKYYATQDLDTADAWEIEFDPDDFVAYHMWAGGNRDFCDINPSLRNDIVHALEEVKWNLEHIDDDEDLDEDAKNNERLQVIKDEFKNLSSVELTTDDYYNLGSFAVDFYACRSSEENDIIAKVLGILHGVKFKVDTFRGSCQGDWMEVIYPEDLDRDLFDRYEALIMGTGCYFAVTDSEVEEDEVENVDCTMYYVHQYNTDEVKQYLADEIGCEPEDIVLRLVESRQVHYSYTYKNY